ncbi:ribosome hibernation-promoting factor, HPF/YfiA family [Candidatus Endomicrobiellum agilis]|jgi:putative sigma-54 modulation protein|uniref:ribosome hibernation-promoting factor, HPF/YfiA family n=1 Tax=Candidatus Endomicrobiellum agilis TaxID=3238957 RepID=UPI00284B9A75|nr:ribosome-associated translation inhibitor RaiA [Endomicrobium sp.]MCA6085215.1 ribosome-associated translation inhibitor RaiA [Endomicrobium sp.]MDR3092380.1 ribosome-associated translation inhibitor RaiA [Endomicrobium sp.]
MQINITARHLKLSDSIDFYVRKKIIKVGKFYDSEDVWVHVILSIEKNRHITEVVFHIGKLAFKAKEQSSDLYVSIDMSIAKLEKQLKKQKEISKLHRKGNLKVLKNKKHNTKKVFSYDTVENSRIKISEIKHFDLKPVTAEEAINEMDNFGYRVYMFKDSSNDKINVLYRNESGSIVLLEPNEM